MTREAKQSVELAAREARALRHGYVGTEHLLLGLIGAAQRNPRGDFSPQTLKEPGHRSRRGPAASARRTAPRLDLTPADPDGPNPPLRYAVARAGLLCLNPESVSRSRRGSPGAARGVGGAEFVPAHRVRTPWIRGFTGGVARQVQARTLPCRYIDLTVKTEHTRPYGEYLIEYREP